MTNIQEIFIPIKGFEGLYEVSQLGRIKSVNRVSPHATSGFLTIKERVLKQGTGTNGYKYVVCRKDGNSFTLYIHRIVAIHFVDNDNNLPQVNHMDGKKSNNCATNLEWCTQSENMKHASAKGLLKGRFDINNPNYKHGKFTSKKQPKPCNNPKPLF